MKVENPPGMYRALHVRRIGLACTIAWALLVTGAGAVGTLAGFRNAWLILASGLTFVAAALLLRHYFSYVVINEIDDRSLVLVRGGAQKPIEIPIGRIDYFYTTPVGYSDDWASVVIVLRGCERYVALNHPSLAWPRRFAEMNLRRRY
jgi:hypothetical protein